LTAKKEKKTSKSETGNQLWLTGAGIELSFFLFILERGHFAANFGTVDQDFEREVRDDFSSGSRSRMVVRLPDSDGNSAHPGRTLNKQRQWIRLEL